MQFDGNFRQYGRLDAAALQACVARQPAQAWGANPSRQERFAVHADTQALHLVYDDDFRHANPSRLPLFEEFATDVQPFLDRISEQLGPEGWLVRCILTKLRSGGRIPAHEDRGFSLTHSHRFHIPVVTNADVEFTVGDETVHMQPGEIWEINNMRRHGTVNAGAEPRVHLIVDWARPLTPDALLAHVQERQSRQRNQGG
jgi:quercetin dioxygenase-like cupin family protein